MFHYAAPHPEASGKLVPFREVKRVYPFEKAYRNTIIKELQETFDGHVEELKSACEALGGTKMPQGDAGYVLPVFPFLNIAVLFWDGDDEFAAQANLLFDSNITDFMHEENVVGVAADAVYYLKLKQALKHLKFTEADKMQGVFEFSNTLCVYSYKNVSLSSEL